LFRAWPLRDRWTMPSLSGAQQQQVTDRAVAKLAAGAWGVVTREELRACGLSNEAIRTRIRRGHLHPLYRGVYAVGHPNVTTEGRWLAAVKACGDYAALSHYAAACHHRWLKWDGRPIDVTCLSRRRHPRIRAHEATKLERIVVRRIPVTPRLRTIVDLARTEPEPIVKRALRAAKFTEAELDRYPDLGGEPGEGVQPALGLGPFIQGTGSGDAATAEVFGRIETGRPPEEIPQPGPVAG
jgi:hypothetical protein